jgi:ubiquinone/menaquinone biosynthesis C-methylase UbiE
LLSVAVAVNDHPMRTLTHDQARRVYDRIGARQDTQAFYEDRATEIIVAQGGFGTARRVFEFGCGTGRFAVRLLSGHLPKSARYRGIDLSPTMVALAQQRLAGFGARAEAVLTDGPPPKAEPDASYDRFVSNYVLDLLSENDIAAVLCEAHRILEPRGLLCLASLSTGSGSVSRRVARAWTRVHAMWPALVAGCRPLELPSHIPAHQWTIRHHQHVAPFGLPSEVLIAERR